MLQNRPLNKRIEAYQKENATVLAKFNLREKGVLIKKFNKKSSWLEKKAVAFLRKRGYVNATMYEDKN
jgi:hypothetical protein